MVSKHGDTFHVFVDCVRGVSRGTSPSKVDSKGYMPMRTQIKRMDDAGRRLVQYRVQQFQHASGVYDGTMDAPDCPPSVLLDPDFLPSVDMARAELALKAKAASQLSTARTGASGAPQKSESEANVRSGVKGEGEPSQST